jgi:molybdopterin synthase sulfur carrier subunit
MPLVILPGPLVADADGEGRVELQPGPQTLDQALEAVFARHPRLRGRLLTDEGRLRPHVNLFVDKRNARFEAGLATAVADASEIHVLPAVSGG